MIKMAEDDREEKKFCKSELTVGRRNWKIITFSPPLNVALCV